MENPDQDNHSSERPIRNKRGASISEKLAKDHEEAIHEGFAKLTLETETGKASSPQDANASETLQLMAQLAKTPSVIAEETRPNNYASSSIIKKANRRMKWRERARQQGASNPRQVNVSDGPLSEFHNNVPLQPAGVKDMAMDIWFTVNPWGEQRGSVPKPKYIRMRNTSATVLVLKKYITKKNPGKFASEDEVEVIVAGHVMNNELKLHQLREIWLESLPSSEVFVARVGDSAEKAVLPLYYASKRLLADQSQPSQTSDTVAAPVLQVPWR